jgi:hypothetical protein
VALKLALHPGDERFEREVELLSRLNHPHVPRLLDSGTWTSPQGTSVPFLVMEWVDGVPLYQWAKRHKPSSRQVLELLAQVARALAATHEVEGVHRDVKGDNVLVTAEGRAVLMDFGSAAYRGARVVTQPGTPVGTPEYWSPEAHLFHYRFGRRAATRYAAGPADDVYALGVMAYRLVTGEYPPAALVWQPGVDLPQAAKAEGLKPEATVTVSPELAALIRQMLSEAPPVRGSAVEVLQALEHAAKTAGRKANRRITQRWARVVAKRAELSGSGRRRAEWLGWGTAAALGVILVVLLWRSEQSVPGVRLAQEVRAEHQEDTAALADAALAARENAQKPESKRSGLSRDVGKPLPGQRRSPCAKHETEIQGGCWIRLAAATPPCGDGYYAWKNGCYWPVIPQRPPATSEQP